MHWKCCKVESFTVAEDFAAAILDSRGIGESELNGWNVALEVCLHFNQLFVCLQTQVTPD